MLLVSFFFLCRVLFRSRPLFPKLDQAHPDPCSPFFFFLFFFDKTARGCCCCLERWPCTRSLWLSFVSLCRCLPKRSEKEYDSFFSCAFVDPRRMFARARLVSTTTRTRIDLTASLFFPEHLLFLFFSYPIVSLFFIFFCLGILCLRQQRQFNDGRLPRALL